MPNVWETRFAEYVRRIAALREGTALELLPDLMPVLPVVDAALPELSLLRRERLCACWQTQAAVAAQQASIAFTNFSNTGALVVIDEVLCWPAVAGAAMAFRAQLGVGLGGAAVTTKASVDTRAGPSVLTVLSQTSAVAQPGLEYSQAAPANPARFGPYILKAGSEVSVWAMTANVEVNFAARWRERSVDPAELNPTGA